MPYFVDDAGTIVFMLLRFTSPPIKLLIFVELCYRVYIAAFDGPEEPCGPLDDLSIPPMPEYARLPLALVLV